MSHATYAKKLQSNIWKLQAITIIKWFLVLIPVIVLFYQENGLSMLEVVILQAVFSVVILITEIPSGYFADIVGRKHSIVIGAILGAIGMLIYTFSYGFWGFLLAETMLAIASGFFSGADSALLYDSMLELKQEKNYKKTQGRIYASGSFSEGIASILGGFIAIISLRHTIYVQAAIALIIIPLALSLTETKKREYEIPEGNLKEILKAAKYAFHDNKQIKWLMLFSGAVGTASFTVVWFTQPLWQNAGIPIIWFGLLWALLQFAVGIASAKAHQIEEKIGKLKTLALMTPAFMLAYVLLGAIESPWILVLLVVFSVIRGIKRILILAYINEATPPHRRATILSIEGMVMRVTFSLFGPIIAWISDAASMQQAFFAAAAIYGILGLVTFAQLTKVLKNPPSLNPAIIKQNSHGRYEKKAK